jgi:hypothetical protein
MTKQNHGISSQDVFACLRTAIVSDIKRHVDSLHQSGIEFYGYAVLPPDYYTAADPTTLAIAFNSESDIDAYNDGEPYYRYSVDEWQNYVHDGFESSNAELKTLLLETAASSEAQRDASDNPIDDAFVDSVYQAVLDAMLSLRDDRTFADVPYLVIWLSDSGDDIMNRSAKLLNAQDVYAEFASEFTE